MEDMPTGLVRRGARYSIRRRIPKDLVEHFGCQELTRALGTADPAEARKMLPLRWAELDREFEAIRQARAEAPQASPERPVSDISPTLISLINLDTLRTERDAAANDGRLKEFNSERHDILRLLQAMLDGEVPPSERPPQAADMALIHPVLLSAHWLRKRHGSQRRSQGDSG